MLVPVETMWHERGRSQAHAGRHVWAPRTGRAHSHSVVTQGLLPLANWIRGMYGQAE